MLTYSSFKKKKAASFTKIKKYMSTMFPFPALPRWPIAWGLTAYGTTGTPEGWSQAVLTLQVGKFRKSVLPPCVSILETVFYVSSVNLLPPHLLPSPWGTWLSNLSRPGFPSLSPSSLPVDSCSAVICSLSHLSCELIHSNIFTECLN